MVLCEDLMIHNVPLQLTPGSRVTQMESQLNLSGEAQSLFQCVSPCFDRFLRGTKSFPRILVEGM